MPRNTRLPFGLWFVFHMNRIQGTMLYRCKTFALSRDTERIPLIKDHPVRLSVLSGIFVVPSMLYAGYYLLFRILTAKALRTSLINFIYNSSTGLKITLDFVTVYVVVLKRRRIIETLNVLLNTLGQLEALGRNRRIEVGWGRLFSVFVVYSYIIQVVHQYVHVEVFVKMPLIYKIPPIFGSMMRVTASMHVVCFCFMAERGFRLVNRILESIQNQEGSSFSEKFEHPAVLLQRLRVLYARLENLSETFSDIYGPVIFTSFTLARVVLIFDMYVFIKMNVNFSHITYLLGSIFLFIRLWIVCGHAHGLAREAERSNELAALLDSTIWDERVRVEFGNMLKTTRFNVPRVTAFNIVSVDYATLVSIGGSSITYLLLLTQIPSSIPANAIFSA